MSEFFSFFHFLFLKRLERKKTSESGSAFPACLSQSRLRVDFAVNSLWHLLLLTGDLSD
jgi:hypothetical protein